MTNNICKCGHDKEEHYGYEHNFVICDICDTVCEGDDEKWRMFEP
jgi:hypothetical protein